MIYTANITTPKLNEHTGLMKTVLKVTKGLVYKVQFYFPPGSAGLMGVAVFDGLYQVWPSNVGEFFVGEDHVIDFEDMYLKGSAPYQLQCYTYNNDTENSHFVSVRIGLVSNEVYMARFMPSKTFEYFNELLASMAAERAAQAQLQRERIRETPFEWMLPEEVKK